MRVCHKCKKEIALEGRVGRRDTCPHCGADLHCCLNCKFYDEFAHNQCKEPEAEWVSDREAGNFCEFFVFRETDTSRGKEDRAEKAKEKFRKLFKD